MLKYAPDFRKYGIFAKWALEATPDKASEFLTAYSDGLKIKASTKSEARKPCKIWAHGLSSLTAYLTAYRANREG